MQCINCSFTIYHLSIKYNLPFVKTNTSDKLALVNNLANEKRLITVAGDCKETAL